MVSGSERTINTRQSGPMMRVSPYMFACQFAHSGTSALVKPTGGRAPAANFRVSAHGCGNTMSAKSCHRFSALAAAYDGCEPMFTDAAACSNVSDAQEAAFAKSALKRYETFQFLSTVA